MRKITDFVINNRYFILVVFICFTLFSINLTQRVEINHDIAEYLPDTSETKIGKDIMESEFRKTSTLNIMFENLKDQEKKTIKNDLEKIYGIDSVDYDNTEDYNKKNYTLYVVTVDGESDSKVADKVYNKVIDKYKNYTFYTSGNVYESNKTVLPFYIIVLAVCCALVILIIMCESYVEPFLFLTSILMAVLLNKGTNIIFGNVSNITNSIAAILQMALSMDYSIMLMNRYNQEKEHTKDKVEAMKNALYKAFKAISSSSLTTIVGLLALVFMSFKLGKDLGFVLAKGVLFSLICIFFVLPVLILMFDKWIVKTKKKSPKIKLDKLGKFSYRIRYISIFVFLMVFIISFLLKGNLGINYTDSEEDKISKIFDENNQIAIIYKNEDEEKISKYLKTLENKEKIEEVLGYGNTIGEKLTYDKLNDRLNELSDKTIEDYLLKIVYYDYYNQNNSNKMTFNNFVNFIETKVYSNSSASKNIDDKTRNDITRLKNFVSIDSINKKRNSSDIASILGIDKSKIDDVLIYYLSKNNNINLSMDEFIKFMNEDVLTNKNYSSKINNESKKKINTLSKFTNKELIKNNISSTDMAKLFGIDNDTMNDLYKYYILVNDIDIKLSLSEFSNFVLSDVINDEKYANNFDNDVINNIHTLSLFSNEDTINKQMNKEKISKLLGVDQDKVNQILLLKYMNKNDESKYSITEFINNVIYIKNNTKYLDDLDISKLESVSLFSKNENNINATKMYMNYLNYIFGSVKDGLVNDIYSLNGLTISDLLTPQEFVTITLETINSGKYEIDNESLNNLKLLKLIIDDSVSNDKYKYSALELSNILNIDINSMYKLYSLIDYVNNNTNNWSSNLYEFVSIILDNKDMDSIKNNIDIDTIEQLNKLYAIMNSSINNDKYSYKKLSTFIGIDSETLKSIYMLYYVSKNNISLSPKDFLNFVLLHKNDDMLKNKIDSNTIKDLELLKIIMEDVLNNKRYSSSELSNLLSINKNDMNLLYGLYSSKYINNNFSISLKEFINFLINDVVTNKDYSNNFDSVQISRLNTVNGIMNATINNTMYTKDEIFLILSSLSDNVDKNTVDMLYIYYGSEADYNNGWKMTVDEFIKFLNQDILNDKRFNDFIENDMRSDIIEARTTLEDAKELLIGGEYSRVILNTKLDLESPETFKFIENTKKELSKYLDKFYIIGDSPIAYEMSQSFNEELNLITIITMIAIFVVVAITFKSILIPTILVLTIQTAVYLTMGILSIVGENVYFISILIVQSILMGATIDYAILYTSYYLENRKKYDVKNSIINSYNSSINTILTSSLILMIVTLIIACFTSDIAAKICKTISEGTLCSTLLILLLLPAVLGCLDKFIIKNKK